MVREKEKYEEKQRERGGESATGKGVAFLHSPPQGRAIQKGKFFLLSEVTSLGNISQNTFLFEYPHIATSTSERM